jgi:hypothetical protein
MKKTLLSLSLIAAVALVVWGCASTTPPNQFEQTVFVTETNIVPKVVTIEQEVWVTNTVETVVTNEFNLTVTNTIEKFEPVVTSITETQWVEAYTHTVSTNALADAQLIGQVVNTFAPGVGSIVGAILAGGLGVWARMRSYKKAGTVLAQNVEAIREFIKSSVPDGAKYDAALVQFMKENQQETGAIDTVLSLLKKYVRNKDAKVAATEIQGLLDSLNKS